MTNGKCHASEVRVKSGNKVSHLSFGQSSKLFLTGPLTQGGRYAKRHVGNVASSVKKLPTQSTVKLLACCTQLIVLGLGGIYFLHKYE